MQSAPPILQSYRQPRHLQIRNVIEIKARKREPAQILISGHPMRNDFAKWRIVGLEGPGNKRYETGRSGFQRTILQLPQHLQVSNPMSDGFTVTDHHRSSRFDAELMRSLHDIEPLLSIAFRTA